MAFASNRSFSLLAEHKIENGKSFSIWTNDMLMIFYFEVLCHEIGHHYSVVSKFQKKMPVGKFHEVIAELYKEKILTLIEPLGKFLSDKSENMLFKEGLDEFFRKEILSKNDKSSI